MSFRTILAACVLLMTCWPQAFAADDRVALGEYLSGECVTCHQVSGANKGIPAIVSWDIETFILVMKAFRKKQLDSDVMTTIASALSDEEIEALAHYFATIKSNHEGS